MKALALLLVTTLAACGWHQGLISPDPNATTVAVEIFGNETGEPDVEADLAPHLSEALVNWVSLGFTNPDRADLLVRGTVTEFRRRNGIRSQDNELLEGSVRIEVRAELVRRKDGTVLRTAETGLWAEYATGTPVLNAPGLGEGPARERLYQNLADRLILELFAADE